MIEVTITKRNTLDRNGITKDNPSSIESNVNSALNHRDLYPEPSYEEYKEKTWWEINWKKIQWIAFGVMVVVTAITMIKGSGLPLPFIIVS